MDRTVIDHYRAEEKDLSDKVHKKLEVLTLIHQPSEDFKKIFVEDMFLKPNQRAFFYVMHFLFVTLDFNEFKKRFYWPITDKKAEANFRTSAVEYLNYINKKHNLQWKQQWNYLVVMPGGNKFLTFLNDLLDFVAKELCKQREKYLTDKTLLNQNVSKALLQKMKLRNQCFKANTLRYVETLEAQTKTLKEKSELIKDKIEELSKKCNIPSHILLDTDFLSEFSTFANKLLKTKITNQVDNIVTSGKNIEAIQKTIEVYQTQKATIKFDHDNLLSTVSEISKEYNILCGNEIDLNCSVTIFNKICPTIDNILSVNDDNYSLDFLEYVKEELNKLKIDIMHVDSDITKFASAINEENKNHQRILKRKLNNLSGSFLVNTNLMSKLVQTPPISSFCNNDSRDGIKIRLPLMEDGGLFRDEQFSFATNQTTVIPLVSDRKDKDDSRRLKKGNATNNSKLLDPSALIRSLTKQKRVANTRGKEHSRNLSLLANKWREQESSFYSVEERKRFADEKKENNEVQITKLNSSPQVSFLSNKTVTQQSLFSIKSPISTKPYENKRKLFLDIPQEITKQLKGSPKNIQSSNPLDIVKLSSSPSGRLDPLVKFDKNEIADILLNDLGLLKLDSSVKEPQIQLNEKANLDLEIDTAETENILSSNNLNENVGCNDVENDLNASNLCILFDTKINMHVKDSIFNVSDSVINDTPM